MKKSAKTLVCTWHLALGIALVLEKVQRLLLEADTELVGVSGIQLLLKYLNRR